jgi:hypothetical protein
MELSKKVKIALDETRILILGVQILLGLQLRGVFSDGYEQLPTYVRYLDGLALGKGTRRILDQAKIAPSTAAPATKSLPRSSCCRRPTAIGASPTQAAEPSNHHSRQPPTRRARGFLPGRLSDAGP